MEEASPDSFAAGSAPAAAQAGGAPIWVQTMDSCKQALGGAGYVLSGGGVSMRADSPATQKSRVASTPQCPLQQGDCATATTGCASFTGVPAGTLTPPGAPTPAAHTPHPPGDAPRDG